MSEVQEKIIMTTKTTISKSRVHGKVKRTWLYIEDETDVQFHTKFMEKAARMRRVIATGFFTTYAYIEQKVKIKL